MNKAKIIFQLFLIIVFLAGIYVIATFPIFRKEALTNRKDRLQDEENMDCPNLLVKKGNVLMLYNTDAAIVDGVNPLPFYNLDEYINYLEIQRKKGLRCPVLYLQQENDAQGNDIYRVRPSPFQLEGGTATAVSSSTIYKENSQGVPVPVIDANRENPPYNANNYAGFDPIGLHVGTYSELDKIHDSTKQTLQSDNPMDPNWGGVRFTQLAIESQKYDDNNVRKPVLFQPRGFYDPTVQNGIPQPKDLI